MISKKTPAANRTRKPAKSSGRKGRVAKSGPKPDAEAKADAAITSGVPAGSTAPSAKAKKGKAAERGGSGLDAAAKVLADAKEPMRCKDIVERALAKGLWKTGGKTPAATINAAMIREIRIKGKGSRFRKTGRGLFAATGRATG